jgi:hypothetical protein
MGISLSLGNKSPRISPIKVCKEMGIDAKFLRQLDFYIRQLNFYFGQSLGLLPRSGISFACHLALAGSTNLLLPGTLVFRFNEMFVRLVCGATSTFVRPRSRIKPSRLLFLGTFASWDLLVEVGECNAY